MRSTDCFIVVSPIRLCVPGPHCWSQHVRCRLMLSVCLHDYTGRDGQKYCLLSWPRRLCGSPSRIQNPGILCRGVAYSWYPVAARILNGLPFLSVPTNDAPDILNWLLTMSVMFIADIGVHNNCCVNKEPAINATTITRPQPVKKNCHRRRLFHSNRRHCRTLCSKQNTDKKHQ